MPYQGPTATSIQQATQMFVERNELIKRKKEKMVQVLSKVEDILEFIPTGFPNIDAVLGGGIPRGRTVQFYGKESTGKSSFALQVAGQCTQAGGAVVYIDLESSFTKKRAEFFNIIPGRLIIVRPESGEEAVDAIKLYADAGVQMIVVDSVPAMVPEKQNVVDEKDTPNRNAGVALTASLISRHIWSIGNKCYNNGTTVFFVNQLRDNIGAFGYGNDTYVPGGRALRYQLSLNVLLASKGKLKVSGDTLGFRLAVVTQKNKLDRPFEAGELNFIYSAGFRHVSTEKGDLKDARKVSLETKRELLKIIGTGEDQDILVEDDDMDNSSDQVA